MKFSSNNTLSTFALAFFFAFAFSSQAVAQEYKIIQDTVMREVVSVEEIKKSAQDDIKFFFRINSSEFDQNFGENAVQVARLDEMMKGEDVTLGLDSLNLHAASSIDGNMERNLELSRKRVGAVKNFLLERYSKIDSTILRTSYKSEEWEGLRAAIEEDENVPYREEVLSLIDDNSYLPDVKEAMLKSLKGGVAWNYIKKHILPQQRYGASMVFYYDIEKIRKILLEREIRRDSILIAQAIAKPEPLPEIIPEPLPEPEVIDEPLLIEEPKEPKYIALKTNLLYDLALAPNIEVEVPIGERWSVGAELIHPWWSSNSANFTQRIRQGHLSLTYWLGSREDKEQLTGWNLGIFGGYGDYDFQLFNESGVQGDLLNTGISIGYAHNIARNLHLHYQLGLGYASSNYRNYTKMRDTRYGDVKVFDQPWLEKRKTWIGPTQLEVSLVWMLDLRKKQKSEK